MASVDPTRADCNRQTNATNLVAGHLSHRAERRITARVIPGGLIVWDIQSQTRPGVTYTVTRTVDGWPADSCSCEDACYRHEVCKHRRAVDLIAPAAPAPAPAPTETRSAKDALSDELEARFKVERLARRSRDRVEEV